MSPILSSIGTAVGGVLAGLACAGGLLWRQQQALARARYAADHDDTTGLPNRRALLAALHRALRCRAPVGVVLLDLDGFKSINDTFGHEAGNDLLAAVGHRLAALGAPVTVAARLSGDEFALLVAGGPDAVAAAAHAAWHAVGDHPVRVGDQMVSVRASVGYATATARVSPRMLLRHADVAMYHAKTSGNHVHGHDPSTTDRHATPSRRCRDRR